MIQIIASQTAEGFAFQLTTESVVRLQKSLGRKIHNARITISHDTVADLPVDLLNQVRLMFWLEDERGLDWEIVDEGGSVLRSSR